MNERPAEIETCRPYDDVHGELERRLGGVRRHLTDHLFAALDADEDLAGSTPAATTNMAGNDRDVDQHAERSIPQPANSRWMSGANSLKARPR